MRCSVLHDDVTGNGLMQCSTGPSLPNPRPREEKILKTTHETITLIRTLICFLFGHDFSFLL